jgi:prepilin-type N-terminal cleavage/methylation domain-containing protein
MTRAPLVHGVPPGRRNRQAGFTMVELLVSLAITTVIMGATMAALSQATRAAETATLMSNVNGGLRTAMDLIVRDMLQAGQGLPAGRVIQIPSGIGAQPIRLPGPPNTAFVLAGATQISAVIPGPALGPVVNGQATDIITTLQADSAFDQVRLTALPANGEGMNVDPSVDLDDGTADDLHPGDLIMLTKGSVSALAQVTKVAGQHVFFDPGDSLNLNQPNAEMGTVKWIRNEPPGNPPGPFIAATATRIRMVSYYLDTATDPQRPRLVRRINNGHETSFDNSLGTAVAFNIENLQFTYDLADGVTNPANVRMVAADLNGTGRCAPNDCSPNQIRKLNVLLGGRSANRLSATQQFFRNSLVTQISLRSLAFVDRYR